MTRTMYDAVTASRIPANALMVAGYVDGLYKWSAADWARFPNAVKVRIAVFATSVADVLDIEQGNDMNPADWVSWAQLVRAHGKTPTAYMNTSTWPSVRKAFTSRGVAEPNYWVAQYDGIASIPSGSIAKQYANNEQAGYDLSIVANVWPGVDSSAPAPTPDPVPSPVEDEDEMPETIKPLSERASGEYVYSFSKGKYREAAFVTDTFGDPNAQLRVVCWATSGMHVFDGQGVFTGTSTVIPFADPANTYAVTIRREDDGAHPVSVNFA